LSDDQKLI
jgi:hypothetical protein